eukprot:2887814-Amphidinium_carterae.1
MSGSRHEAIWGLCFVEAYQADDKMFQLNSLCHSRISLECDLCLCLGAQVVRLLVQTNTTVDLKRSEETASDNIFMF